MQGADEIHAVFDRIDAQLARTQWMIRVNLVLTLIVFALVFSR